MNTTLGEIGTRNKLTAAILKNVFLDHLEKNRAEHCQGDYVLFYPLRGLYPVSLL